MPATAQMDRGGFNPDYVAKYEDLDIYVQLLTQGFDARGRFEALDWSSDEKSILLLNKNHTSDLTSLLVLRPFDGSNSTLDYSFSAKDVLKDIGRPNAGSLVWQARFSPNDTNVVYIVMEYWFLPTPDAASLERYTGIYRFNQTGRTTSTIYEVLDNGTDLWFDFVSDPNRLLMAKDGELYFVNTTNSSTTSLPGIMRNPQDVSNDGKRLLLLEWPDTLRVLDLETNKETGLTKAFTGQPHEDLFIREAYWVNDDYVAYTAGFIPDEPRAPLEPVILAVQTIGAAEPISYEIIHSPFRVGKVQMNPDATSILVSGEGYGQHDVFKLYLVRAIPEFPSTGVALLLGTSIILFRILAKIQWISGRWHSTLVKVRNLQARAERLMFEAGNQCLRKKWRKTP